MHERYYRSLLRRIAVVGLLTCGLWGQQVSPTGAPSVQVSANAPAVDETEKLIQRIGRDLVGFGEQLVAGGGFGYSIAPLGDFDGDGVPDIAVVAPEEAPGGVLYLLFLRPGGKVKDYRRISATEGGFGGDLAACSCGFLFVDCAGDINGDGVVDLVVGAPMDPSGGTLWILFLDANGEVLTQQRIANGQGGLPPGTLEPDTLVSSYFGWSVAGVGDFDGDGTPDIVTGAPGHPQGGFVGVGAIFLLFMNPDGTVREHRVLYSNDTPDFSFFFGMSVAQLGDLDGNGVVDLATSFRYSPNFETEQEDVMILFMQPDGSIGTTSTIDSVSLGIVTCCWWSMGFGRGLASIDDLDGDGLRDLIVGKPAGDFFGDGVPWGTPSAFIFNLSADGSIHGIMEIADQTPYSELFLQELSSFGWAVVSPGDLDGDGRADLVVGAPNTSYDDGMTEQLFGELTVLFHLPD